MALPGFVACPWHPDPSTGVCEFQLIAEYWPKLAEYWRNDIRPCKWLSRLAGGNPGTVQTGQSLGCNRSREVRTSGIRMTTREASV